MKIPRGSRYTRGLTNYKTTGRFGVQYGHPPSAAQRGYVHTPKYAELAPPVPVEFWLMAKEAPAKSQAQARFMAHHYEEKERKGEVSKEEAERKKREWMHGSSELREKTAADKYSAAVQAVAEAYGIDLTRADSLADIQLVVRETNRLLLEETA